MQKVEFDKFADEYYQQHARNIAITGQTPEYFAEAKVVDAAAWTRERNLFPGTILDFGAGIGNSIPFFRKHFPLCDLLCADVSERSLALVQQRFGNDHKSVLIANDRLPLEDESVDLAFTVCVFHHIEIDQHLHWLTEIRRVVRSGELFILFEHNNPLTVRAVNTCPFDVNAHLIRNDVMARQVEKSGWPRPKTRFRIFFPRLLSSLSRMERWMYWIPLDAQYALICPK